MLFTTLHHNYVYIYTTQRFYFFILFFYINITNDNSSSYIRPKVSQWPSEFKGGREEAKPLRMQQEAKSPSLYWL